MQSVPRERPRLRQDLLAETVEHQGARFIDVMAPEGGEVFRFYESEYSLACGMDGERDIAGLVKWAQDELGMTPSQHEVRTVIAALGDLGFIDRGEAVAPEAVAGAAAARDRAAPSGVALGPAGATRGPAPPPTPDVALGAAGAPPPRVTRPTPAPVRDVALGAAGARGARPTPIPPPPSSSEVSVDLSDHIAVRPDDVKEAVRASKVMSAVEATPDVLVDRPTAPASAFDAPTVMRAPETARLSELTRPPAPAAARPPAPPSEFATDTRPDTRPEIRVGKSPPSRQPAMVKAPVELPQPPQAQIEKTARVSPPSAPRTGVSPVLLVVLVLAVIGAGVFFAWRYVIDRPATDASTAPAPAPVRPAPPPPAPPPPAPTARIALETPDPEDVKLTRAGVIETVLADNSLVKEGDVIVKFVGDKPIEAELAGLSRDQKRLQDQIEAANKRLDAARAGGNKAAEAVAQAEVTDRHKALETKQNKLAAKTAELDTFLVHSPATGTFSPAVKLGQKVALNARLGKIERDPIPVATFKLGNTRSFAANAGVELAIRKGEQRVTCTVADVQSDSVKVTCPVDPELTEGTEVALQAPEATAPPAPGEATPAPAPGAPGAPAGSGAAAQPAPR